MDTKRLNLLSTLRRRGFNKIPLDFVFCDSQKEDFKKRFGHDDYESFFEMSHRTVELEVKRNYIKGQDQFRREEVPADTKFDEYGIGHSKGSELAFHMTRMHHPLKGAELEEIQSYPYPAVDTKGFEKLKIEVAVLHEKDLAVLGFMQMTVWEASWYLRSMDELMIDMMMEDEIATTLFDKITDFACEKAKAYAQADVDILSLGDDIGTQSSIMIDIDTWKTWLQPRLKKVIDTAKAIKPDILILYHSCGYIVPFIDALIGTGVEILNPIQPECMNFDDIHDQYGDRVSFWGTIGTQQLLPFGTKEEVYETSMNRLKKCGKKGGIVIGPTHIVEPEVPWENLLAIKKAVDDYSKSSNWTD